MSAEQSSDRQSDDGIKITRDTADESNQHSICDRTKCGLQDLGISVPHWCVYTQTQNAVHRDNHGHYPYFWVAASSGVEGMDMDESYEAQPFNVAKTDTDTDTDPSRYTSDASAPQIARKG